jgi:hypothetical protein
MIDWFVLLIPLAALPIVALFAFVGCQLIWGVDDYNLVGLQLPAGLHLTAVDSMEITIKVTGESGESSDTVTLNKAEFPADGDPFFSLFIPLDEIDAEEHGSAHCQCSLFFADGPPWGADLHADHDGSANELFVLTFTPPGQTKDDFHLT